MKEAPKRKIPGLEITEYGVRVDDFARETGVFKSYTPKELTLKELSANGGLVVVGETRKVLDTEGNEYLFVMHPNRKLYVDSPMAGVTHSSLLGGADWPIATGTMVCCKGKVTKLSEDSRHFASFNRLWIVLTELRKQGVQIDASSVIKIASPLVATREIRRIPSTLSPLLAQRRLDRILANKADQDRRHSFDLDQFSSTSELGSPTHERPPHRRVLSEKRLGEGHPALANLIAVNTVVPEGDRNGPKAITRFVLDPRAYLKYEARRQLAKLSALSPRHPPSAAAEKPD